MTPLPIQGTQQVSLILAVCYNLLMLIQQIIFGFLAIAVGVVTLKYNYQLVNNTFRLEWIESKLGPGMTFTVYKLFSVLLVTGGILFLTGLYRPVLTWLLSPLAALFPKP